MFTLPAIPDTALDDMVEAITGSAALGLVVGVVRRFRDLVWIVAGIALSALYGGVARLGAPARS